MLRVLYELADLEPGMRVEVRETRGTIRFRVSRTATLEEALQVLNGVTTEVLAGGQWFQFWKGEIVTIDSPADSKDREAVARLHRGSLV